MAHFKCIDIQEAKKLMSSKAVTIVDIRDPESYSAGHIDQAILLKGKEIDDFLTKTAKDKPLICYCYHGFSSQDAAHFFSEKGFVDVYSIEGGFEAWRQVNGGVQ